MDQVIAAASQALALGDALGALKRVALRDDPPALALRGMALAQLGDLSHARELLRAALRGFDPDEAVSIARCELAAAEIALVLRDLDGLQELLESARTAFEQQGDRRNAAHAAYLLARLALLIGRLEDADRRIIDLAPASLPAVSRPGYWLVVAGIAMRRIEVEKARLALERAEDAARRLAIPTLVAEVGAARRSFHAPAARLIADQISREVGLTEVAALFASDRLLVDACRNRIVSGDEMLSLGGRPVLFGLLRALAEAWPRDVPRKDLLSRVFRARQADESHRARLRVEIGRLRQEITAFGAIHATQDGYVLQPHRTPPAVLAPPIEGKHPEILALLADGEAWTSSALALALHVSPRTVQRALDALLRAGKVEWFSQGRSRRWILASVPGFPTGLFLAAAISRD